MKPIKIYITPSGPNPWKVIFILEELDLSYEIEAFGLHAVKEKPYTDINPNGRVPAIQDPNTDLTLWESGAIIQYLIEQYDTAHKLSYPTLKEKHLCNQWLAFQISAQGPYFGQAFWFSQLHSEKLPSAIERYNKEAKRILGVLETSLVGKQWLVGDKCTFADMAFVPYNDRVELILLCEKEDRFEGFPNVKAWHERMAGKPSWGKLMEKRAVLLEEKGL
ncbi:glutathione S-transferase [Massarina eburnea CBS 473.64]|uniref:glutathione transferase n=1 Tax=Massarina eburnea CBS 473.64 TaxID=1395130 RepID=A0A6A6RIF2_9PLEO|nr:glutathione S-transferase [Massarina eburnea CBS 473.64]